MPTRPSLHQLEAWQAAQLLARREITAVDLMRACLDRIAEREPSVHAFAHLAADAALAQAKTLDAGASRGPLHGLPLGVKDIFDTADMPTAYGSPIYARHRPMADAAAVALCRAAGAIVVGKTVTTELANMHPAETCNPHRLGHTPGGSSSGSAAAVADGMLPLALGTQTAGSLIRPAAFCGVVGYKASYGRGPRAGVKGNSETLDTLGGFGRCVRDVALLASILLSDDRIAFTDLDDTDAPRIGFCATPDWPQADADTQQAWDQAARLLAPHAAVVDWPAALGNVTALQKQIQAYETAQALAHERLREADRLSAPLRALLEDGLRITSADHASLLERTYVARQAAGLLFENVDVLISPSSLGEAPAGLKATGDPLFCRGWTLLGLPCVHLPFARGRSGLPVGLQMIGRQGEDHRLLAAAHWAHARLTQ